ncbi:discoidin domain-containing protein [Actinokineospora sp. NBRC 105648]|uniref:galactose-binding domain-containing protein n=1 Tax=Actinokineospora sp. NBRC 105648 TaxID=3032206 RepID=UPI0024A45838|nr:discoidin domain-containing protein [Actinokineospora sp. NBRC 105648]GLZ40239.1 hypothetical protein Acsp05_38630 [Actinokineospora sp. NBRC 105648]
MRLPAKRHLPTALALVGLAALGVIVPTAAASPNGPSSSPTTVGPNGAYSTPSMSVPPSSPPTTPIPPTTTTPRPPRPGENFARSGTALASSTYDGYAAAKVNDGDVSTAVGEEHSWANDEFPSLETYSQWVEVRWPDLRSVGRIVLYTSEGYQLRDFDVQVLHESGGWWDTVKTYNYNTATTVTVWLPPRNTRGVRIVGKVGPTRQVNYARVNEIEAYAY